MSRYTAVRLKKRGIFVDVAEKLTVCEKMGHLASYCFVREIKSDVKESMFGMEINWKSEKMEHNNLISICLCEMCFPWR
jgi:hypothetical protein